MTKKRAALPGRYAKRQAASTCSVAFFSHTKFYENPPGSDYLATRNWKNASIEHDREDQNITLFDWYELEKKCDKDPERVTWVTDFYEYFADDGSAIKKIEDG